MQCSAVCRCTVVYYSCTVHVPRRSTFGCTAPRSDAGSCMLEKIVSRFLVHEKSCMAQTSPSAAALKVFAREEYG